MNTKSILMVRHGATAETENHQFAGSTDSPLSAKGRLKAESLRSSMVAYAPDACLCSPMLRCQETASILLPEGRPAIEVMEDLREMNFGDWEGKTFEEIAAVDQCGLDRMWAFDPNFAPSGGESLGEFFARVQRVGERTKTSLSKKILVVTHGGVIRSLLQSFFQFQTCGSFYAFEIAVCSMVEVILYQDGTATLRRLVPCELRMEEQP